MGFDEAFGIVVDHCAAIAPALANLTGHQIGSARTNTYQCDIWVAHIVQRHYRETSPIEPERYVPFYDAAWELCRIGVLRPGQHSAAGVSMDGLRADGYSITTLGYEWLKNDQRRSAIDPSRMATIFRSFSKLLGEGFEQRSTEAISCHRNGNYLATCVLAGAAAESVLLAVAIGKVKNETKVLDAYAGSKGRSRVMTMAVHGLPEHLTRPLHAAMSVLQYWRDDAAHGMKTTISEVEAYTSLAELLRFSRFCSDNWIELTT
ncbi:hypothetical protein ACYG9R_25735 [Mesorhizobium sp. RSR565B]|uniref:hypothetical protein n=1 Tax=Mesorhizobium sp. L103C565B0 TaxID=1287094 RepID=UPI0003CFD349|nr:hypothetical protein [Mesorhizobium sp. L103C565B0]ESZ44835.1 hypothetical protein X730_25460 [Mesorhizobium sp. L103C565B0]